MREVGGHEMSQGRSVRARQSAQTRNIVRDPSDARGRVCRTLMEGARRVARGGGGGGAPHMNGTSPPTSSAVVSWGVS